MRTETKTYEIFTFDELSETAKTKALAKRRYWNVSDEFWYEHIFEDAKELGIDIVEFDTYRMSIRLELKGTYLDTIASRILILKEHWRSGLYKAALEYLTDLAKANCQDISEDLIEALISDLETEFKSQINAYFIELLAKEYEYQTSDEAIAESLISNECEFLKDGSDY